MNDSNFSLRLLDWYAVNGRQLPWRLTRDPYRIWISEVILQQTRVAQGYDYFMRFIRRFPMVEDLAQASEDEVLRIWQGLGYYSRARNLHAASRQIVAMGGFPHTYDTIRSLKGVGDYTAAAIASLAYDLPYAVVDGNVYRVLSRYFGICTPIDSTQGRKFFSALAQEMLVSNRSADYNQAIMDFGALQCVPKSPQCSVCPLSDACQAFAEGRVGELPVKQHFVRVRHRFFAYVYVRLGNEIFLHRRSAGDIWQGLYQPAVKEGLRPLSIAELENWLDHCGRLTLLRTDVQHQLTHQRLHADFYLLEATWRPPLEGLWIKESERDRYAVPRLVEELYKSLTV